MEFVELFQTLESYGLTDALLPFLLIFLVLFAVLQKTHILGHGRKNFNAMFAFLIALMVVIPHVTGTYPEGSDPVELLQNSIPQLSVLFIAIIMVLIMIGLLSGEAKWLGGSLSGWVAIISFIAIVYVFGANAGWWTDYPSIYEWWDSDTTSLVNILLVFAIVVW